MAAELQDRLRLRPFGRRPASELANSLLPHAIESDRLAVLAELALTERRAESSQSWLVWLRQIPEATKPAAMLGLIERLNLPGRAGPSVAA